MLTINPVYARITARELLRRGFAEADIFRGTGSGYRDLFQADELDLERFQCILGNADALLTDPPLGFLIGSYQSMLALGPLGSAAGAAPTIRDAMGVLENYTRLHSNYIDISLHSDLTGLTITLDFQGLTPAVLRHHTEASLVFIQRHVELVTGESLASARITLCYPAPDYADQYPRFLDCAVEFDATRTCLAVPRGLLDLPSPYFHHGLWEQAQLQLASELKQLGEMTTGAYTGHVRASLLSQEPPLPSLGDIAGRLHMSERTLSRRLQAEGTGFRELRSQVLHDWAVRHLRHTPASVESIALQLGYHSAANFRRAFRERAGVNPAEFRRQPPQQLRPLATSIGPDQT